MPADAPPRPTPVHAARLPHAEHKVMRRKLSHVLAAISSVLGLEIWTRRSDGFLLCGCAVFWAGYSVFCLWLIFAHAGGERPERVLPYVGLSVVSAWMGWRRLGQASRPAAPPG